MNKLLFLATTLLLYACKPEQELSNASSTINFPLQGNQVITLLKPINGNIFLAYTTGNSCRAYVLNGNYQVVSQPAFFAEGMRIKDIIQASNNDYYLSVEDGEKGYIYRLNSNFDFLDSLHVTYYNPQIPMQNPTLITEMGNLFESPNGRLMVVAQRFNEVFNWLKCPTLFYFNLDFENTVWGNPDWASLAHPLVNGTKSIYKANENCVLTCGYRGMATSYSLASFSRTDSNGRIVREYYTFGKTNNYDKAIDIASIDASLNVGLVQTTSFAKQGNTDIQLYLLNNSLDTLRSSVLALANDDIPSSIAPLASGGFLIAGISNSLEPGKYVSFLMKVNANLQMEWIKSFGGEALGTLPKLSHEGLGRYLFAYSKNAFGKGWNQNDMVVTRINEKGEFIQ